MMTRPSNYLIRMAIFLGVITAGVIFLGPSLLDAFWASPVLNGIIVGALLIGIGNISNYFGTSPNNTSSKERMIDDYLVSNLQIDYNLSSRLFKNAKISFLINNLFDIEYVSNAWIYRYISNSYDPREGDDYTSLASDGIYDMAGYFPQAKRNYLLGLTLEF